MNLAILFVFHVNPEICVNRLEVLRTFNPDPPVYGLYGGKAGEEEHHRAALRDYLDDFFAFPDDRPANWRALNSDEMMSEWYRTRGKDLPWESLFLLEWDMVVAGSIRDLYRSLKPEEILIPGLRPLREIERWWVQVCKWRPKRRAEYLELLDHVRKTHGFDKDPLCGYLFGSCLPRPFLAEYSTQAVPELGFLEYKMPIYAQIFGTPFCTDHAVRVWWDKPVFPWISHRRWNPRPPPWMVPAANRALNASKRGIPLTEIRRQLRAPGGSRLFHPVYGTVPLEAVSENSVQTV